MIKVINHPDVPPGQAYLLNLNTLVMTFPVPSRWDRLANFLIGRRPPVTGLWDLL